MTKRSSTSQTATTRPAGETVADDLACFRCSYNLRSLPWDARCPECGQPVTDSLPPPAFRFGKLAVALRIRQGLGLLVIAIVVSAASSLCLLLLMRYNYAIPRDLYRIGVRMGFLGCHIADLLTLVSLLVISYPYGRRGDRFLQTLWFVALFLVLLAAVPTAVWNLAPASGGRGPFGLQLEISVTVSILLYYGSPAALVLTWVYLLVRVRPRANTVLWTATLCVLLTQTFRLTHRLVPDLYRLITVGFGYSLSGPLGVVSWNDSPSYGWLHGWERQINGIAWIITVLVSWVYLRALNAVIPPPRRSRANAVGRSGAVLQSVSKTEDGQ